MDRTSRWTRTGLTLRIIRLCRSSISLDDRSNGLQEIRQTQPVVATGGVGAFYLGARSFEKPLQYLYEKTTPLGRMTIVDFA